MGPDKLLPSLNAGLQLYEYLSLEGNRINEASGKPTSIDTLEGVEMFAEAYHNALKERLTVVEWSEQYKNKILSIINVLKTKTYMNIPLSQLSTPEQIKASGYKIHELENCYCLAAINMQAIALKVAPFILEDVRVFLEANPNPHADLSEAINELLERYDYNIAAEQNNISEEQNSIRIAFITYNFRTMAPSADSRCLAYSMKEQFAERKNNKKRLYEAPLILQNLPGSIIYKQDVTQKGKA
jgi:hypothetical protein